MIANLDENLSSCEYQLDNIIQRTSKRTKKKSKRSGEVFGTMEGVYGKIQQLEKKERFRKYKGGSSRVQGKIKYRSKETRKVGYG